MLPSGPRDPRAGRLTAGEGRPAARAGVGGRAPRWRSAHTADTDPAVTGALAAWRATHPGGPAVLHPRRHCPGSPRLLSDCGYTLPRVRAHAGAPCRGHGVRSLLPRALQIRAGRVSLGRSHRRLEGVGCTQEFPRQRAPQRVPYCAGQGHGAAVQLSGGLWGRGPAWSFLWALSPPFPTECFLCVLLPHLKTQKSPQEVFPDTTTLLGVAHPPKLGESGGPEGEAPLQAVLASLPPGPTCCPSLPTRARRGPPEW